MVKASEELSQGYSLGWVRATTLFGIGPDDEAVPSWVNESEWEAAPVPDDRLLRRGYAVGFALLTMHWILIQQGVKIMPPDEPNFDEWFERVADR